MEKNIYHPVKAAECTVSPLANYELNARIVANNAPADGVSFNGVHYTLTSPVNLPVANRRLEFSVNGTAIPVIPTNYTNNSGVIDVALTNTTPETVQLNANLADDTSVIAVSLLTFIPVGPMPTYELTSRIVRDNIAADGNSQNAVEYYLTFGGIGVSATISVSDPIQPPISRTTGPNGLYTAYFTSTSPGSFNIIARLQSDSSVSTYKTITFTPVVTYPVFLGSNRISVPSRAYFLGVESLFGSLVITAGHRYTIRGIPTSNLSFSRCPAEHPFVESNQSCSMEGIPDFTLLSTTSISPIIALNSGVGENLHSNGYYFNNSTAQEFMVDVFDEGQD